MQMSRKSILLSLAAAAIVVSFVVLPAILRGCTNSAGKGEETYMLNVKDFGAKGDGDSDDTAAIQKALYQAAERKGTVYFPKGIYTVNPNRPLIVESGSKLIGDGRGSVIRANGASFGRDLVNVGGEDIEIRNVYMDGNNSVNRVLVIKPESSRIKILNSVVANASHSSVSGSDYYSGVVSGIIVYGNTDDIAIDKTEVMNITALNPVSGSWVARGIYVTTSWGSKEKVAKRLTVTNSDIHDIGPADDGDGIYYEDPNKDNGNGEDTGSSIVDNRFFRCAKRAVKIYADGIATRGNHITNSYRNDNYYRKDGSLAPDMFAGISIYGNNNTVEKNVLNGIGSYYAAIEVGASQLLHRIVIANNDIAMGDESSTKETTAIRLGDIEDFAITSNTISNGERGIWTWRNAKDGLIRGNTIRNIKVAGIDLSTYVRPPDYPDNCRQIHITCKDNRILAGVGAITIRLSDSNEGVQVK